MKRPLQNAYDRLASAITKGVSSNAYAYSLQGLLTNETVSLGTSAPLRETVSRSHDAFGRPSGLALGDGYSVAYGYDDFGRLASVSNTAFSAAYAYLPGGLDAGWTITLTNGKIVSRMVTRDSFRGLVTAVTNAVNSAPVGSLAYGFDVLGRVVSRNADTFGYNVRSELTGAAIGTNLYGYAYDGIGNALWATNNGVGTAYQTNPLNQYTNILRASAPTREIFPDYDSDGNMLTNGVWSYTWDAENRLIAAYSNALCVVSNAYDHQSRRVLKLTPAATHTFLYDGWNLIKETIQGQQSTTTNYFVWGKDLSDTLQGAGGVGGLLAVSLNGSWHFPLYDNNGNVTAYADESGNIVATYSYDAFGQTIAHSGLLADAFPHRFSTKLFDPETGLYYYGYRFYAPEMMRWMNRDPIGEQGGEPLYAYVSNEPISNNDPFGLTNEPRGYPPDPVWGLYSRLPPLSQIEEQEGYCGPDVTAALDATLVAVEAAYMVSDHKLAACCVLQGAYGYQRAANAWMINTLTGIGLANQYFDAVPEDQPINKESPNWKFYVKDHRLPLCHMRPGGGHRRCISTVTYRGRCYRATNLNFALFGKAVGLCHRNLGRPFLKAGFTILAAAIAKADQTRYPDIPQAVAVSVAFAFGGGMPLMATPGCAAAQEPNAAPVSYLDGWSWDYVRE